MFYCFHDPIHTQVSHKYSALYFFGRQIEKEGEIALIKMSVLIFCKIKHFTPVTQFNIYIYLHTVAMPAVYNGGIQLQILHCLIEHFVTFAGFIFNVIFLNLVRLYLIRQ